MSEHDSCFEECYCVNDSWSGELDWDELCHRVVRTFTALPECDRTIIRLRVIEELPVADVAIQLGIHPGAVRMRCARALYRLRQTMFEEPFHGGKS